MMPEPSITQKYLICALGGRKRIIGFSVEKSVCFVAAALLELQLDDSIGSDRKRVFVLGDLPAERGYLKPLYDYIAAQGSVKIEKLVSAYHYTITNKRCNALIAAVGASLVSMGAAEALLPSLPGGRARYFPKKEALQEIIEELRTAFLLQDDITAEAAVLGFLLSKGRLLKDNFSLKEQQEIKRKLKDIQDSPEITTVKEVISLVEDMIVALTIYTSSFS